MTQDVTVEGTLTPAAGLLARGERATWAYTDRIKRLVQRGFLKVVSFPYSDDADAPVFENDPVAPETPAVETAGDEPDVPKRNASREAWGYFLESQGMDIDDESSRDELIEQWERANGESA